MSLGRRWRMMLGWRSMKQTLVILAVFITMLLASYIVFPYESYGLRAVRFSREQLEYLRLYASGAEITVPTPKERSEVLKTHVKDACRTLNISLPVNSFMMAHMHYDDDRKIIYCFIPKVACTSWKRVWMKLTGIVTPETNLSTIARYTVHTKLPLLASAKDKSLKLDTYKKFMFVRHPFDRVLSAYKDKLENFDKESAYNFHKQVGKKIEKKYRNTTMSQGHNITFSEFIRFISEPGWGSTEQRNEHWISMHEICNPCGVEYDFIGKYETIKEDSNYVLDWLGVKDVVDGFPSSDRPFHARRYDPKYFNQLDQKAKLEFFSKYLADFLAFNYDFLGAK
ncbi:carbohydrate sulfotransferase 11 isoform X3 [Procambarus clarkii]|uniref:carbohydrate sulfotransferase 11 isoform X3 n=1 Tax=Procambarus clarkii TaxID=6728 RepID=UPI001E67765A|nr:carbohydrate sulfotransferase 11-like isoform X2 [Procambarus clarkii]